MNPLILKQLLKAIGIGSTLIIIILAVVGGFIVYRNILEAEKLKQQIRLLKLNIPVD